jgi:hypothetical protein
MRAAQLNARVSAGFLFFPETRRSPSRLPRADNGEDHKGEPDKRGLRGRIRVARRSSGASYRAAKRSRNWRVHRGQDDAPP